MKYHQIRQPQNCPKPSKPSKMTSFERIKTWRHPEQFSINERIPAEEKYSKICDMLMFNYFDQTAFGSFINGRPKDSKGSAVRKEGSAQRDRSCVENTKKSLSGENEENSNPNQ